MPFFSVRKGIRSGPVTSSLPRGAVTDVEAASAPPVVCATGRGVAALPLLLVSNIVLFRVQGCEEGLEIRAGGIYKLDTPKVFRRPGTAYPRRHYSLPQ